MQNEYIKPNIELVKSFINNENVVNYSFRLENEKLTDEDDGIINFKNYKRASSNFDCDRCELTMSICCVLLQNADFVKEVLGYQGRQIRYIESDGNIVDVETDTINSLETELNKFVRNVIKRRFGNTWVDLYTSGCKIVDGQLKLNFYDENLRKQSVSNRDSWLVNNYEQLFDVKFITEEEKNCLTTFNLLADKVHTVGNFMIGPVGFNSSDKRAKSHCSDRFDIFMEKVLNNEDYCDWKQWFLKAKDILYIDGYFSAEFNDNTTSNDIIDLRSDNVEIWGDLICELIEKRSNNILQALKEVLKSVI